MAAGTHAARISWTDAAIDLDIAVAGDGRVTLARLAPGPGAAPRARAAGPGPDPGAGAAGAPGLPLADIVLAGSGRSWSGTRYCHSVAGQRMRYAGHAERTDGRWRQVRIDLDDPETGLRAEVGYRVLIDGGVLRSWVRLVNRGTGPVTVESVTSFLAAGLPAAGRLADLDLMWAENDWLAEHRWQTRAVYDALPDLTGTAHLGASPRGRIGFTSAGTWSTGAYLPMGAVVDRRTGQACAWQIEHNGAWHWQAGQYRDTLYVALLGPADTEHHWRLPLAPGESFTTVPVAVAVSDAGFEGAIAGLTAARRAVRRPHPDHAGLPVIFNDYMNTLMGDPSTELLVPLISAAAAAGAEYFVIDAGWYADAGEGWWDSVGQWKPSATRFTGGLPEVLDRIRAAGMIPGLWLEPEVVGVRSPVADTLPPEAFFERGGQRVVEHGRYHLDLRHPAAVKHLDEVVDYLVGDLGVGYFKLDYNITVAPGPDTGGASPGAGLLEHNRAHLQWLDRVLDRHLGLTIENCASGGMRTDYAMLSRLQLQSTSDQQDYRRYPAIAAAAPAAIAPEQAAVWAYPQPGFTADEIAFTLCSALLGRIHLSGHLDQMSQDQRDLVAEAVRAYQAIRADLARAVPFWPLGLPGWADPWLALGMRAEGVSYLVAWRRGPLNGSDPGRAPAARTLPIPHLAGEPVTVSVRYPAGAGAAARWSAAGQLLTVELPRTPSACLIELRHEQ